MQNQHEYSHNKTDTDHAIVIFLLLIFTPLANKLFYMSIKEDFSFYFRDFTA